MASRFDSWASYFYPPPDDRTLRNLFDERDPQVLSRLEYVETADRQRELIAGEVVIPRTYDADHVRAIHRHLFQDVYQWAGEFRTVEMFKGAGRSFGEVGSGEIDRLLADVRDRVAGTEWGRLDRDEFGLKVAEVFAYLNQAHPFREGNGRTSKVFMEHVAERSRFTLDFARVSPVEWNMASMLSRPDTGAYHPHPDSLVPVFRAVAVERRAGAAPTADPSTRVRSIQSASYPQAPTQATERGSSTSGQQQGAGPYRPGRGYGDSGQGIGR